MEGDMDRVVRVFPLRNVESLKEFAAEIERWDAKKKSAFFALFGHGREHWYVQQIDGRPYVIAITEGEALDQGYERMANATDEFSVWFRRRVRELSGFDLSSMPKGPVCEHVFSWGP
jgi:hypothetical protein